MIVAIATGSLGVLSEAIHSALDLVSSLLTFFVVRAAVRPADWDHQFGHGKIESISALFEAFLLFVAGAYIIYEGIDRTSNAHHHVQHVGWGLAVLALSMVVNLYVYLQNRRVAHAEESIAIETNAFHFLTDIFSSFAVFLSLGVIHFTNWEWLDPVVAIGIAIYIGWIGVQQMRKCIAELSDTALPESEVAIVKEVLVKHRKSFLNYHDLRSRRGGSTRYLDLHLTLCSDQTVGEAHEVCDQIENELMTCFKNVDVNIHVEPCGTHGEACREHCKLFNKPRK